MSAHAVRQVADALLYEGYLLYPYRASSLKNRQRWTFGRVYPRASGLADGTAEAGLVQTECLLEESALARLEVTLRFLHLVDVFDEGPPARRVGQEAVEREVVCRATFSDLLARPQRPSGSTYRFEFPARREVRAALDGAAKTMVLAQERIVGSIEITAEPTNFGVYKLSVRTLNLTPLQVAADGHDVPEALLRSFISTHAILCVEGSKFVSLLDPPGNLAELAATCRNVGVWPVLAGDVQRRDTLLASPILLDDFPRVAPESPGDMFDGTEIDELLTLRIQTLTPDEKHEMRAGDGRARALLDRAEALGGERLFDLHGTIREPRVFGATGRSELCSVPDEVVRVNGNELRAGDAVRLRPRGGADAFDVLLAGQSAIIESIEQDYEGRVYLAVTVTADPGRDLGRQGKPGHRFFYRPDEVEPLSEHRAAGRDPPAVHVQAELP